MDRERRAVTTPKIARAFFAARFRAVGTPTRAAHDRAYLKSDQRFYGATLPQIRRAGADFHRHALSDLLQSSYRSD